MCNSNGGGERKAKGVDAGSAICEVGGSDWEPLALVTCCAEPGDEEVGLGLDSCKDKKRPTPQEAGFRGHTGLIGLLPSHFAADPPPRRIDVFGS